MKRLRQGWGEDGMVGERPWAGNRTRVSGRERSGQSLGPVGQGGCGKVKGPASRSLGQWTTLQSLDFGFCFRAVGSHYRVVM